jgi:hypothetical protein
MHTGEYPYTCYVCNKPFSQQHHLMNHQCLHIREHPCTCGVCIWFIWWSGYSEGTKYVCTFILENGRYNCKVWEKSFTVSGQLKAPELVYTGQQLHSAICVINRSLSSVIIWIISACILEDVQMPVMYVVNHSLIRILRGRVSANILGKVPMSVKYLIYNSFRRAIVRITTPAFWITSMYTQCMQWIIQWSGDFEGMSALS